MRALLRALPSSSPTLHRPDSAALSGDVAGALRPGDVVAIKGSLGSKMKVVVDAIVAASGGEAEE
jgi:UDP-N-acetylmuramoyl-tripeptide--D-alanyl-D-alanine ligase